MRSLVLAAALAVTAAAVMAAVVGFSADAPSPAADMDRGSTWQSPSTTTTTASPSTTIGEIAAAGIPITGGTDPSPSTPPTTAAAATTTTAGPPPSAPATTAAPRSTTSTAPTTTAAAPTTIAPYLNHSYASKLLSLANSSRASQGLAALTWSDTLASTAGSTAVRMADTGALAHSNLQGLTASFSALGENIGRGYPSPSGIHSAWMSSGSHRDNILGASFTHVGIAAWVDATGQVWVSQIFGG